MSLRIQNSRQLLKRTNVSGATPTVNTGSTQHTDGTWTVDEIYAGEFYWNMQDTHKKLYLGWEDISGNTGVELIYPGSGSTYTFTGGSGNCIADFYVSNIFGCSPINLWDKMYIQTGVTFTSADDIAFMEFDNSGVGLINIASQPPGGTFTKVALDGDTMQMGMLANSGELASIDLAYDNINNETSIALRTEDATYTEASSINMDKDGISLFSSTNTLLINSTSLVGIGQNQVNLTAGREIFGVTPTYVYHSNTSIVPSSSLENFIFYHNEKTTTTGTTPTTLYSIPFTGGVNTVMTIKAIINGSDNVGGDVYGAEYFGVFKSVGGVVTQISTLDKSEKTDFATASTDIIISGTNIIIQVTGEAATTIKWVTRFNYTIS